MPENPDNNADFRAWIRADPCRQARLEALLLEGLEGAAIPATDEFWDEMLRQFDERHPEVSND